MDLNFAGPPLLMRTQLDYRMAKLGVVTDMMKDVLGGQPCHCIYTTASRGFSATAEFLVLCIDNSVKSIIDQLINTDANLQTQVTTLVAENDVLKANLTKLGAQQSTKSNFFVFSVTLCHRGAGGGAEAGDGTCIGIAGVVHCLSSYTAFGLYL